MLKTDTEKMQRVDLGNGSWIAQGQLPQSLFLNFEDLWTEHPAEYGKIAILGRIVETPRWQQTYLRNYNYTGMDHEALPLPETARPVLDWANGLISNIHFNQVMINWYQNGLHYIGPHSDDIRQLVHDSPILSVSLGCERMFRIRDKASKTIIMDIPMPDRSFLVMGGTMQRYFTHEVPKVTGAKGERMDRRINITFRVFK